MSVAEPLQPVESAPAEGGRPHLELVPSVPALDDPAANEEVDESEVVPASEEVDLLRTYVRQIGNGRLLTAQEEALLAKRKDAGDMAAKARLIECNNHLTQVVARDGAAPREVVLPLVLMVAPLAPHVAEELWARLGHADTLTYESFPVADPSLLVDDTIEVPVQVNGKVRTRITVPAGADAAEQERLARADSRTAALLEGKEVRKVIVVPGRTVNFVLG